MASSDPAFELHALLSRQASVERSTSSNRDKSWFGYSRWVYVRTLLSDLVSCSMLQTYSIISFVTEVLHQPMNGTARYGLSSVANRFGKMRKQTQPQALDSTPSSLPSLLADDPALAFGVHDV